jgi:hypothetical protein
MIKLLTLHPDYFLKEGFGTLMGHYAVMYSLHKDTGIIPCILDIDFKNKSLTSAMEFFNQFDEPTIHPHNAFKNISKIFNVIQENFLKKISWKIMDFTHSSYDDMCLQINNTDSNILCRWTLSKELSKKYINEITKKLFIFDDSIIIRCKELLPKTQKDIVGVCVRNEYKKIDTDHVKLSMKFYENAMNQFDIKNTKYLIFSDDIDECKEMFKNLEDQYDIEYTNPMPSAIGLCAMSLCDHNICANSSFSYWASTLNQNPNKKVVCSTKFIQDNSRSIFTQILNYKWYPKEWIALDIS